MNFDLSEGESAWRDEVRAFLRANVTEALLAELRTSEEDGPGPARIAFDGQVAAQGWNALTWPKEYGGLAMGPIFHMLLTEEFLSAGVPPIGLTATMLAPVIIRYGSAANKGDWLPGIKQGTTRFALGYSEPDAG